jgi:PadR family transcriptional regulator PadR
MEPDRRSQWLRGVLDLTVLALLAEGEAYGYQLTQALERRGLGRIKGGTLYPVLLRLERLELVTSGWREGDAGPARKYYQVTPAGRATLRQEVIAWRGFTDQVHAIFGEVADRG